MTCIFIFPTKEKEVFHSQSYITFHVQLFVLGIALDLETLNDTSLEFT